MAQLRGDADLRASAAADHGAAGHPAGESAPADDPIGRAIGIAAADPDRISEVLSALAGSRVWVPMPGGREPETAAAPVTLPVLTYLGADFVPAFTSHRRLLQGVSSAPEPVGGRPVPHLVVRVADLAAVLPAGIGLALNPGAGPSVAVSPHGLAELAAGRSAGGPGRSGDRAMTGGTAQGAAGQLPALAASVLAAACMAFAAMPAVSSAQAGWLAGGDSAGLLIMAVSLDDPADAAAQRAVTAAAERAVPGGPDAGSFGVEVIFPGAGPADLIESWIAAAGTPFYCR